MEEKIPTILIAATSPNIGDLESGLTSTNITTAYFSGDNRDYDYAPVKAQ
jgi:hypothetical protein